MEQTIQTLAVMILPILLAITLHEAAHGYAANYFGDPTARMLGRLSLNPARHIDPVGTILLPLILYFMGGFIFGYAKPVPITTRNLRNPKVDMVWVALAGPAANIFLAFCGGILLLTAGIVPEVMAGWYLNSLYFLVFINCLLAVFNLLPIPPLDGSRVLAALLPGPLAYKFAQLDRYGLFIVIGVIFFIPFLFSAAGINFPLGEILVFRPAHGLYEFIIGLFGG